MVLAFPFGVLILLSIMTCVLNVCERRMFLSCSLGLKEVQMDRGLAAVGVDVGSDHRSLWNRRSFQERIIRFRAEQTQHAITA